MFCSSCGSRCHENVAFCSSCGSRVGGNVPSTQVSAQHSTIAQTVMVRDFRCNGCGAPLRIPQNSSAPVRCPSCKTECVIERLVRNAEMAAKENIASGLPLSAAPAVLHNKLVSCIVGSPNIPLNIFEKAVVVRQEHHCIPAFYFRCNGTAAFTYEAGKNVRRQEQDYKKSIWTGDTKHVISTIEETDWTIMNSITNAHGEVVASGNKQFAQLIRAFYKPENLNSTNLYDYSELEFPHDVWTHEFNVPETTAFNEYAKPLVDELLMKNAKKSLEGKTVRDLALGGSRIEKEEMVRIFLGLYRIVLKYNNTDYAIWVSADGERAIIESMPIDERHEEAIEKRKKEMERALSKIPKPKNAYYVVGGVVCIILGTSLAGMHNIALFFMLGLVGAAVCGVIWYIKTTPYRRQYKRTHTKYQKNINEMESMWDVISKRFINQGRPMRGIYEGIDTTKASSHLSGI